MNLYLKKQVLLIVGLLLSPLLNSETPTRGDINKPISLDAEVIKFIDGLNGLGIDGQFFGMLMKLRIDLNNMRFGIKQPDGSYTGYYEYQENKITVKDYAELEKEGMNLSDELTRIKKDFHEKMQPFMQVARGTKQHMVALITEWAQKTKRMNSFLLNWARTPEGQEYHALETTIKNFQEYDQFLADLIYYLESLMRSCPKAYKQFKDLIDQKQKEKASAAPAPAA